MHILPSLPKPRPAAAQQCPRCEEWVVPFMHTETTSQGAAGMVINGALIVRQYERKDLTFSCPKCGVPMLDHAYEAHKAAQKAEQLRLRKKSDERSDAVLKVVGITFGCILLFALAVFAWS